MTAKLPLRKRILYYLLTFGLLYLVIEMASYAAIRIAFPSSGSLSGLVGERSVVAAEQGAGPMQGALPEQQPRTAAAPYLMHPYYGYIAFQMQNRDVNDLGFVSQAPAIMRRSPDRLIVAVAGGSVAYFASTEGREALARELRAIPEYADKEIVVTTYAMGAYKQPQHLMVINDILARGGQIDILILIDGLNEAVLGINTNRVYRVDPFFPLYWWRLAEDMPPISNVRTIGRIEYLWSLRKEIARVFSGIGADYSMFASLIWKSVDSRLERSIAVARSDLVDAPSGGQITPDQLHKNDRVSFGTFPRYSNVGEYYEDAAANWATASLLLDRAIEAQGGRFFHFLQPNQYFPGAKPLSKDEKELLLPEGHPQYWNLATGYPYFRAAGERVQGSGVSFHDLTYLFENETVSLYRDSCCHVNQKGSDILMKSVGEAIVSSVAQGGGQGPSPSATKSAKTWPSFDSESVFGLANLKRFAPRGLPFDDGRERAW